MKRLISLALLALVCTACDSAAGHPSQRETIVARERVAALEAHALLALFVPPPGSVRLQRGHGYGASQQAPDLAMKVTRSVGWRVPLSFTSAVKWMRTHGPKHYVSNSSGSAGGWNGVDSRWIEWDRGSRYLEVFVDRGAHGVTMRVDSTAIWIYPRPARDKVPAGTFEIDIRSGNRLGDWGYKAPKVSLRVTDSAKVAQIVRWFDALPAVPPRTLQGPCSLGPLPDDHFIFKSADGTELARATVPIGWAGPCQWMDVSIAGKKQLPVVDTYLRNEPSFFKRVEKLLGARLT